MAEGRAGRPLFERKYLRVLPPSLLAGLAASLFEMPPFFRAGFVTGTPWEHVGLASLATIVAYCMMGVGLGLLFEAAYHVSFGTEPPPPLRDVSRDAKTRRRETAAHVIAGFMCVLGLANTVRVLRPYAVDLFFDDSFSINSSIYALIILASVPWWLVYMGVSRLLLRTLNATKRLRHLVSVASVGLITASCLVVSHRFAGLQQMIRAVFSMEAGLSVFVLMWLLPSRMLHRLGLYIGVVVLLSTGYLALRGLPHPTRALLQRSHGFAANLVLRSSSARGAAARLGLRHAMQIATAKATSSAGMRLEGRKIELSGMPLRKPDIILITFDSLRPDKLGCYGSRGSLTPNLDRFAATAWVLSNAFAPAARTVLSLDQTMSGRLGHEIPHLLQAKTQSHVVDPGSESVAVSLSKAGYKTVALMSYPLLSHSQFLGQGFEVARDAELDGSPLSGREVLRQILANIDQRHERPLFVWGHIMDVHHWEDEAVRKLFNRAEIYDRKVALLDDELGLFFSELLRNDQGRQAIVIVTADHGEALGEQGLYYHGFMAPATLRIPLLIRFPGLGARRIATAASLLDLAPTILAEAGLPRSGLRGVELKSLPDSPMPGWPGRPVFHEALVRASPMVPDVAGVTALPWQLLYDYRYDTLSLINLDDDPKGEVNLAGQNLPQEDVLIRLLKAQYDER